jgi:hypothetical protein
MSRLEAGDRVAVLRPDGGEIEYRGTLIPRRALRVRAAGRRRPARRCGGKRRPCRAGQAIATTFRIACR